MNRITLFTTMALFHIVSGAKTHYNILSIDGGGIRGLIPAMILRRMEEYAYEYVTNERKLTKDQIVTYPNKTVALKDLFDMTAGTSTGSILATGLVYPKDELKDGKTVPSKTTPKFYANDLIGIYADRAAQIFSTEKPNNFLRNLWMFFCVFLFGLIGWERGLEIYDNKDVIDSI